MKTDIKIKKDFDAVALMRSIRNEIDKDIKDMPFKELKNYIQKNKKGKKK